MTIHDDDWQRLQAALTELHTALEHIEHPFQPEVQVIVNPRLWLRLGHEHLKRTVPKRGAHYEVETSLKICAVPIYPSEAPVPYRLFTKREVDAMLAEARKEATERE